MISQCTVLIESDWNLKDVSSISFARPDLVLIESDWNLKTGIQERCEQDCKGINRIRLEFKTLLMILLYIISHSINRIRLEFKRDEAYIKTYIPWGINRIRLEFKALLHFRDFYKPRPVLIESDWNLK